MEEALWTIVYCGGDYYDYPEEVAYFTNEEDANTALSEIKKYIYNRFIIGEAEEEVKGILDKAGGRMAVLMSSDFERLYKKYGYRLASNARGNVYTFYNFDGAYYLQKNFLTTNVEEFVKQERERIDWFRVRT